MVTNRATSFNPPSSTATRAMAPLTAVAMAGWPVRVTRARNRGASPSVARACNTRGPPSALPKLSSVTDIIRLIPSIFY